MANGEASPSTDREPRATEAEDIVKQFPYARTEILSRYIPEVDPTHIRAQTTRVRMAKRSTVLGTHLVLVSIVIVANVSTSASFWSKFPPNQSRIGTLMVGNCSAVSWANSGLHLLLNIVSSLFLASGSYCMQILIAPSRALVDRCHQQGNALDIGVLSVRNLRFIEKKKTTVWVLLGALAVLLHLFWNSAVFSSIPMRAYSRALVTRDFMKVQDEWNSSYYYRNDGNNYTHVYELQHNWVNMTKLENQDCISKYIDPTEASGNIIIVASNYTAAENNGSSLVDALVSGSYDSNVWWSSSFWICTAYQGSHFRWCSADWAATFASNWTVVSHYRTHVHVDHCLVGEQGDNKRLCGLHYSVDATIIVCVCTLIDAFLILWVWHQAMRAKEERHTPMVTTGDAIASFLREPGKDSRRCNGKTVQVKVQAWPMNNCASWFSAVGMLNWFAVMILWTTFMAGALSCLKAGIGKLSSMGIDTSVSGIWQQGFQVHGFAIAPGTWSTRRSQSSHWSVIGNILFVNSWQAVLVADEWMRFIPDDKIDADPKRNNHRKPLRVSCPVGIQRSSYTLSLPLKYSAPNLLLFSMLHWMVSQSVYFVEKIVFGPGQNPPRLPEDDTSQAGYSLLGIVLSIAVCGVLMLALLFNSFLRKYSNAPRDFPSLATNSIALAAVCQRPDEDTDAYLLYVGLGIIPCKEQDSDGWLAFSTFVDLQPPRAEKLYQQPVLITQDWSGKLSTRKIAHKMSSRLGQKKKSTDVEELHTLVREEPS